MSSVSPAPQPPPKTKPCPPPAALPLKEAHTLLTTFVAFLTVSIHNILYYRHLYPSTTFLTARAYNLPVHQNRHPKVCTWVTDAVEAVASQLATGTVGRVGVAVHAPLQRDDKAQTRVVAPGAVLERWMFDVSRFPSWPGGADAMREYGNSSRRMDEEDDDEEQPVAAVEEEEEGQQPGEDVVVAAGDDAGKINWTDVEEQFRAVLRRLSYTAEQLGGLPAGCTFTVAVELKEEGRAPIGHPQPWIPSQPNLQRTKTSTGSDLGGAKTMPIRTVEAGPLFFECWVEEGKAKEALKSTLPQEHTQKSSAS